MSKKTATCPYSEPERSIPRFPFYFFKVPFNIIVTLLHGLLNGLRPSHFSTITSAYLFSPYHFPCSPYPAWFHFHNNVRWGIQIMTLFISQFQGRGSVWYFVTWCFLRNDLLYHRSPQACGLPLVSCPRLHIQCSRRCCPYLEAVCFIRILRKCRTVVTRTHVHDFELRHVSAKIDPCCKQTGVQLNMIGTEELASDWRVWGVQKVLRHRVGLRKMYFPSFCNQF